MGQKNKGLISQTQGYANSTKKLFGDHIKLRKTNKIVK